VLSNYAFKFNLRHYSLAAVNGSTKQIVLEILANAPDGGLDLKSIVIQVNERDVGNGSGGGGGVGGGGGNNTAYGLEDRVHRTLQRHRQGLRIVPFSASLEPSPRFDYPLTPPNTASRPILDREQMTDFPLTNQGQQSWRETQEHPDDHMLTRVSQALSRDTCQRFYKRGQNNLS